MKTVTTTNIKVLQREGVLRTSGNLISNLDIIIASTRLCLKNGLKNSRDIYEEVRMMCDNSMLLVLESVSFKYILRKALQC